MGPTLGHMPKHIAAAGVDATKIDTIMLTHMHPDHSNGLTDANGKAIYPHVELVVAERDVAHWHDDAAMARATERQQMRFFRWAREQIAPYQDQPPRTEGRGVSRRHRGAALRPHARPHRLHDRVEGRAASDLGRHRARARTCRRAGRSIYMEPDVDPQAAVATRERIFDMVATDRLLAAGMHMHFPGFLNLNRRAGGGYELFPKSGSRRFNRAEDRYAVG